MKAALQPLAAERESRSCGQVWMRSRGMASSHPRQIARRALRLVRGRGAHGRSTGTAGRSRAPRTSPRNARAPPSPKPRQRAGSLTIRARSCARAPAASFGGRSSRSRRSSTISARPPMRATSGGRPNAIASIATRPSDFRQPRRHRDDVGPAVERRGIGQERLEADDRIEDRRRARPRAAQLARAHRSRTCRRRCGPRAAARYPRGSSASASISRSCPLMRLMRPSISRRSGRVPS